MPPAALVTARALAPLPRLLPLAARFLTPDGTCLFLKGAKAQEELSSVEGIWAMDAECIPSETSPDGAVLRVKKLRREGGDA